MTKSKTHYLPEPPSNVNLDVMAVFRNLRAQVQKTSGTKWTQFNASDSGVLLLEYLAYALVDLAYKSTAPIEVLLKKDDTHQSIRAHLPFVITEKNTRTLLNIHPLLRKAFPQLLFIGVQAGQANTADATETGIFELYLATAKKEFNLKPKLTEYLAQKLVWGERLQEIHWLNHKYIALNIHLDVTAESQKEVYQKLVTLWCAWLLQLEQVTTFTAQETIIDLHQLTHYARTQAFCNAITIQWNISEGGWVKGKAVLPKGDVWLLPEISDTEKVKWTVQQKGNFFELDMERLQLQFLLAQETVWTPPPTQTLSSSHTQNREGWSTFTSFQQYFPRIYQALSAKGEKGGQDWQQYLLLFEVLLSQNLQRFTQAADYFKQLPTTPNTKPHIQLPPNWECLVNHPEQFLDAVQVTSPDLLPFYEAALQRIGLLYENCLALHEQQAALLDALGWGSVQQCKREIFKNYLLNSKKYLEARTQKASALLKQMLEHLLFITINPANLNYQRLFTGLYTEIAEAPENSLTEQQFKKLMHKGLYASFYTQTENGLVLQLEDKIIPLGTHKTVKTWQYHIRVLNQINTYLIEHQSLRPPKKSASKLQLLIPNSTLHLESLEPEQIENWAALLQVYSPHERNYVIQHTDEQIEVVLKADQSICGRLNKQFATKESAKLALGRWLFYLNTYLNTDEELLRRIQVNHDTAQNALPPSFYPYQLSWLFPDWPARTQQPIFKATILKEIKTHFPCSVHVHVHFLSLPKMCTLTTLYNTWDTCVDEEKIEAAQALGRFLYTQQLDEN